MVAVDLPGAGQVGLHARAADRQLGHRRRVLRVLAAHEFDVQRRELGVPADRVRTHGQRVGNRVFHDRIRIERAVVGAVFRIQLEDVEVHVGLAPALLGVIRVDLGLVPRDFSLRGGVLVFVDHAQRVAELVADHAPVFAQLGIGFQPAVVHRRLAGRHAQRVGAHGGPGKSFLGEADADLRGAAGDELQLQVGDGFPLARDVAHLRLHRRVAVEEFHLQRAPVLPQLQPLDRGAWVQAAAQRHDAQVVDALVGGGPVGGAHEVVAQVGRADLAGGHGVFRGAGQVLGGSAAAGATRIQPSRSSAGVSGSSAVWVAARIASWRQLAGVSRHRKF